MSVIFNRIFIHAGKALAYQSMRSRSILPKLNGNFIAQSTLVSVNSNSSDSYSNDDSMLDDVFHPQQNSPLSVLEEVEPDKLPDLSHIAPELRPSFNFAYFANKSEVIQQLIDLGVDFHKIESRKKIPTFLLQLDFEKDVKPYISFLFQNGVPADQLGRVFTKNPFLLEESLDDLEVRINYFKSKKFTPEMITRLITTNPRWLSHTTQQIDTLLGNFQKELWLTGDEIRAVVCRCPDLIHLRKEKLTDCLFFFKDVIGFDGKQTKELFLKAPYIWTLKRAIVHERMDIMLIDMKVPLSAIVAQPSGLQCRGFRLKQRHLFLEKLGKAQYDPTKPGYVSINDISIGNDATFCDKVAKTSVHTFNLFLKTL
ncbi:transcription termination factor 3, mitochondrial [Planococcus citri]|uniref:transcription termination factor 3, mitochondrial n=1 Tax=Planococcus citri TaxID=170843 RepID=UPI0031F83CC3